VDLPSVSCLVVACGGNSVVGAVQRVGRALRVKGAKQSTDIIDFIDYSNKTLYRHSQERINVYTQTFGDSGNIKTY